MHITHSADYYGIPPYVLFENVVVDIVLDDFPVYINCALCCRFRSFPFRRRSRFPARRGVRGKDRNGNAITTTF